MKLLKNALRLLPLPGLIFLVVSVSVSEVKADNYLRIKSFIETQELVADKTAAFIGNTSTETIVQTRNYFASYGDFSDDYYSSYSEKANFLGIRYAINYSFSDPDLNDVYKDNTSAFGLDLTFDTKPNFSWRFSIDKITASVEESGASVKLSILGLSFGGIFRTSRTAPIQPYGGLELGFYPVTVEGSFWGYSTTESKSGMGYRFLAGVNVSMSENSFIGLQLTSLKLDITDFDTPLDSTITDLCLTLRF
jgi:hypothetical protein